MKRKKMLSWMLSVVMALTVFAIPVGGFADVEDNYCIGWYGYDESSQGYQLESFSNEDTVHYSAIDGEYLGVYDPNGSPVDGDGYSYHWTNSSPGVSGIEYVGNDGDSIISKEKEFTTTQNSILLYPQKAGSTKLSVSVYNGETLVTSLSFTVIVDENNVPQYRIGKYANGGVATWGNGQALSFSQIGAGAELSVFSDYMSEEWQQCYDYSYIVWKSSDPSVAAVSYRMGNDWDYTISNAESTTDRNNAIILIPKKEGTTVLTAYVYDDDAAEEAIAEATLTINVTAGDPPKYRLGYYDPDKEKDTLISGTTVNYTAMKECQVHVNKSTDKSEFYWAEKIVWKNTTPSIAKLAYYDSNENYKSTAQGQLALTGEMSRFVFIEPLKGGTAKFTVDVYDNGDLSTPIASIPLNVSISQKDVDREKYERYLEDAGLNFVDYDERIVSGYLGDIGSYNYLMEGSRPVLKTADLDNLTITATIKGIDYKATINKKNYTFSTKKFPQVPAGTKVTVTFKMGTYVTKQYEVVTRYIDPKITVKNYTYNGKKHKAVITVKLGKTVLKKGTDYELDTATRKDVGRASYSVYGCENGKYRFGDEGYFKINPKGTTLKKLVKDKKAITVKWGRQAAKMSKNRITGYQIQIATNSKFTKNKKLITVNGFKKTSKKITKLKAKKNYFVRVRTYMKVGKIKYYSTWSKVKSIKTR